MHLQIEGPTTWPEQWRDPSPRHTVVKRQNIQRDHSKSFQQEKTGFIQSHINQDGYKSSQEPHWILDNKEAVYNSWGEIVLT